MTRPTTPISSALGIADCNPACEQLVEALSQRITAEVRGIYKEEKARSRKQFRLLRQDIIKLADGLHISSDDDKEDPEDGDQPSAWAETNRLRAELQVARGELLKKQAKLDQLAAWAKDPVPGQTEEDSLSRDSGGQSLKSDLQLPEQQWIDEEATARVFVEEEVGTARKRVKEIAEEPVKEGAAGNRTDEVVETGQVAETAVEKGPTEEAAAGTRQADEEEVARRRAKEADEERRAEEEAVAASQADKEEVARRRAENVEEERRAKKEAAAKRQADEKEVARRQAKEVDEKRQAEEEVAAERRADEEEVARRRAEEAEERKRTQDEAAKRRAEEERAKRLAGEEVAKRLAEEEAARKQVEEETAKKLAEEDEAAKEKAKEATSEKTVEEAAKRQAEDVAAKLQAEEVSLQAEEAVKKRAEEEEAARMQAEAEAARKQAEMEEEVVEVQQRAEEHAASLMRALQQEALADPARLQGTEPEPEANPTAQQVEAPQQADPARAASADPSAPGAQLWKVVGGSGKGGILVREGKDKASAMQPLRLSTGSIVRELEKEGDRLMYEMVEGRGPQQGWVQTCLRDEPGTEKHLLARHCRERPSEEALAEAEGWPEITGPYARLLLWPRKHRRPRLQPDATVRSVFVFGSIATGTNLVMRELPRFFNVKVVNTHFRDNPHMWKHTVFSKKHLPRLDANSFCVCLVKDPTQWIQSLGRDPRAGTFYEIAPLVREGSQLVTAEAASMSQLFSCIAFNGLAYDDALQLWASTVRGYFLEGVFPPAQTAVVRYEDTLFHFADFMKALEDRGLPRRQDSPFPVEPLDETAKDDSHPRATRRGRDEILRSYSDLGKRSGGLNGRQRDRLRDFDKHLLSKLGYDDPKHWLPDNK